MATKKVRDVIAALQADGWMLKNQEGSHRHYVHATKSGKVTVNGKPADDLGDFLVKSIERQSGLKF